MSFITKIKEIFIMLLTFIFGRYASTWVECTDEPFEETDEDASVLRDDEFEDDELEDEFDSGFNMSNKIFELSKLLKGELPEPDIDSDLDSQELLDTLEDVLVDTGYINAQKKLANIDPRIRLIIANKQVSEPEYINIYVDVYDKGWTGAPTGNTLITKAYLKNQ